MPPDRQALDALIELTTDQLNRWAESSEGDREGAVSLLLALIDFDQSGKVFPDLGKCRDYLLGRLRDMA